MKRNLTLALVACMILGQSTTLFSQSGKHKLGKFKLEQIMTQDPDANGKSKMQSIREALEWRNSLLVDENGNSDPSYYMNAVKQADQLKSTRSQRSSASLVWQELGPGNVGGRTRSILYDNRDPNRLTIYAGAVGGGIWKSTNGGDSWTELTSVTTCIAISCIAQDVNGLIYYGTGEGLSQPYGMVNSGQVGNGLHIIYGNDQDSLLPSTAPSMISNQVNWSQINRIAINPNNPQDILVATSGGSGGLMHSRDGGQTWIQVGTNNEPITGLSSGYTWAADVKYSSDGNLVFASVGIGSLFGNPSPGVNFIMSLDGGNSWKVISNNNFPQYPSSVCRIEIGVAPSEPNTVYFDAANSSGGLGGIYKSSDAGTSWTLIGSPGGVISAPFGNNSGQGQGWYDNVISVNPFDADKVYFGGTQLYTYSSLSGWHLASIYFGDPSNRQWVHPDMHAIVFNDKNKDEMFVGCDGGVFKSENAFTAFPAPAYTVKNRGYAVTQNYSVAADYYGCVMGGAQDNGTNYVDYLNGGTTYATNVYGGDGVYTEISHFNPNIFIGGYVGGNDFRSSTKGVAWVDPFDGVIDPKGQLGPSACGQAAGQNAPFMTEFWLEESKTAFNSVDSVAFSDTITHYAGETLTLTSHIPETYQVTLTDSIHKGDTVKFVDPLNARLYFATYCGLWMTPDILDFTKVPRWFCLTTSNDDIKSLAASSSGDTIYIGRNSYVERLTGLNSVVAFDTALTGHKDNVLATGARYSYASHKVIASGGRFLTGIDVDRNDPTHVLCAVAGYSNAGTPHVYVSHNSGASWTGLGATGSSQLPNMPVYQCLIDVYNPSHYIVGSELGVWDSYDDGATWAEENDSINARLPVFRLRQQTYLSDQCYALYIGTHGRGMWRSTTLTSASPDGCNVNPLSINTPKTTVNGLMVYPNPVTGLGASRVRIDLSQPSDVTLRVIDMPGRLLQEVSYTGLASGKNELNLNTSNLSNGTYLVVATLTNGQTMTRTITVAK